MQTTDCAAGILTIGASPNFGLTPPTPARVNLTFVPDARLRESWCNWFNYLWAISIPLTAATVEIPRLVPAEGSLEAARLWSNYVQSCRQTVEMTGLVADGMVSIDPETGEVVAHSPAGEAVASPSESVGIARLSPTAEKIVTLFEMGSVVTIDKTTRTRPLDAPMKAQWFGIEKQRQIGVVTRKVEYRISLLDDALKKEIEKSRTGIRGLLDSFSYPLADGVRWMPKAARDLFEQEMTRINTDGSVGWTEIPKGMTENDTFPRNITLWERV